MIGVASLPLPPGLSDDYLANLDRRLSADDAARSRAYPGPSSKRQPVHTVYIPADQFHVEVGHEWAAAARAALATFAPGPDEMAEATGLDADALRTVWAAMVAKLADEPIEDLRIDLEDGYGSREDEEEDRSEEHTSELQSRQYLVCRLLLEK